MRINQLNAKEQSGFDVEALNQKLAETKLQKNNVSFN